MKKYVVVYRTLGIQIGDIDTKVVTENELTQMANDDRTWIYAVREA